MRQVVVSVNLTVNVKNGVEDLEGWDRRLAEGLNVLEEVTEFNIVESYELDEPVYASTTDRNTHLVADMPGEDNYRIR